MNSFRMCRSIFAAALAGMAFVGDCVAVAVASIARHFDAPAAEALDVELARHRAARESKTEGKPSSAVSVGSSAREFVAMLKANSTALA